MLKHALALSMHAHTVSPQSALHTLSVYSVTHRRAERTITPIKEAQMLPLLNLTTQTQMKANGCV